MIRAARRGWLTFTLVAAALAGGASAAPGPRNYQITIKQMAYGPVPAGARVGDVVEWVNADMFRHTVTARNGDFDVDLPPNAHRRTVLRRSGEVSFYCRYHPGMTGVLRVAR